ncbi:Exocyst complex component 5 [Acorus calamus]|uniref:Exocyst complex component 5 n=1 Tax=Acorus calamus TaxID=4465 RepID=A0AAV9E392_ACOCL|nr:Exocyst complex component 5 [Acorus calamus]
MFVDVEVMNADIKLVLGDHGLQSGPGSIARGLSALYKDITETVRKEAATINTVFPSPNDVMSILVQRVLEQRVSAILDKLLVKPSLVNLPPVEEGGLLLYLRILPVAFENTQELAKELKSVGCGELDVEGLTESIFLVHKNEYPEYEQASLRQLYQAKMEELRAESQQQSDSTGTTMRSKGTSAMPSHMQISVTVATEFISQYTTEGLERAREGLNEAAALRERFVIGASVSRRVVAAAASAAEAAAAAAGENSFKSFMVAVQRCASSVVIVQQYFMNSISRLLLPVDGAHGASCDDMGATVLNMENTAYKGLQQCIDTVMAEVERLLSAEQKITDNRSSMMEMLLIIGQQMHAQGKSVAQSFD